jgi:hypothetical protein
MSEHLRELLVKRDAEIERLQFRVELIAKRDAEIERLRARVKSLKRVLHGIAEFCEEGDRRTFLAVANTARAALKEAKP